MFLKNSLKDDLNIIISNFRNVTINLMKYLHIISMNITKNLHRYYQTKQRYSLAFINSLKRFFNTYMSNTLRGEHCDKRGGSRGDPEIWINIEFSIIPTEFQ